MNLKKTENILFHLNIFYGIRETFLKKLEITVGLFAQKVMHAVCTNF